MATEVKLEPYRTYATRENAEKALNKYPLIQNDMNLRYLMVQNEAGRWYPVFLGQKAVEVGVHHVPFCIAG